MSIEHDVHQVEYSIEEARQKIERGEALSRLEKNKDFQSLILQGLLREDAIRQVQLLAAPGLKVPGDGAAVAKLGVEARINMIGELNNFFRWTHMEAESARDALMEHEQTREELLAEQLAE